MKKSYLLLFTIFFQVIAHGQVKISNSQYATLKAAFDAINAGTHTGAITISIQGNTTETATAILNASGSGSANYTSITISPQGARSISGNIDSLPLIDINGAAHVTINGLNTGGNSLTLSNTAASAKAGTSTIRFIGGAKNNTVTNCTVSGSAKMPVSINGGTVYFATDTTRSTMANDSITISNCNIAPAGNNLPSKAIYANGSQFIKMIGNNHITITGNNIYDFFNADTSCAGLYVKGDCAGWQINNNKFYQTTSRSWNAGAIGNHRAIEIFSSQYTGGAKGFTINSNIIGYANSNGTGVYTLSGAAGKFTGIYFTGLTGDLSTISNNTIASVSLTGVTSAGSVSASPMAGVMVLSGNVNVYNNTVGSQYSPLCSIVYSTTTTSSADIYGVCVFISNSQGSTVNNNKAGGIVATNLDPSGTFSIYGVKSTVSRCN